MTYDGETEALRQRIKELIAERDEWRAQADRWSKSTVNLQSINALIAELRQRTHEAEAKVREQKEFLTVAEASAYLRVSPQVLAGLRFRRKSPPFRKVGNRVLYERNELEQWVNMPRRGNYE